MSNSTSQQSQSPTPFTESCAMYFCKSICNTDFGCLTPTPPFIPHTVSPISVSSSVLLKHLSMTQIICCSVLHESAVHCSESAVQCSAVQCSADLKFFVNSEILGVQIWRKKRVNYDKLKNCNKTA